MIKLNSYDDIKAFVDAEILTSKEAQELLNVTRSGLSNMIKSGNIKPLKKYGGTSLFLKSELLKQMDHIQKQREKYRPWDVDKL